MLFAKNIQGSTLKYLLPAQKELIVSNIQPLKMLTTEITFLDPIFKAVAFGLKSNDEDDVNIDDREFIQVELIKTFGNNRSNRSIIADVVNVFQQFFNPLDRTLGQTFDHNSLTNNVFSVDGVSSMRTRRLDTDEFVDGLSFFIWNPTYPQLDRGAVRENVPLGPFEFLYFQDLQTIANKFVVIEDPYINTRY